MKDRIKLVRKVLNLTQQEFAERIGSVQNTITGYETGRRIPSNQVIQLICREFNVSEQWLRTGEGEMFDKVDPDEEFVKIMVEIQAQNDEFIISAMKAYWELPEEHKQVIRDLIRKIGAK